MTGNICSTFFLLLLLLLCVQHVNNQKSLSLTFTKAISYYTVQ